MTCLTMPEDGDMATTAILLCVISTDVKSVCVAVIFLRMPKYRYSGTKNQGVVFILSTSD